MVLPEGLFLAYRSAFSIRFGMSLVADQVCRGVARSHWVMELYSSGLSASGSICTMRSIPRVLNVSAS